MSNLTTIRERLISARIATDASIQGCSDDEIKLIQSAVGLSLPSSYKDFVRAFGKGAGSFMRDINIYFPAMIDFNRVARELLADWEDNKLSLPSDAFVFAIRQGDQFMFFHTNDSPEDPAIWYYMIGTGKFKKVCESIWEVIDSELRLSEDFRQKYPDSPLLPGN